MGRSLGRAGYDVVYVTADNKKCKQTEYKSTNKGWSITSVRIGSCVYNFICTQYFVEEKATEAQAIWGGIVKRLLIVYFIGSIAPTNVKIRSRVTRVKVIASQMWDVFQTRCTVLSTISTRTAQITSWYFQNLPKQILKC